MHFVSIVNIVLLCAALGAGCENPATNVYDACRQTKIDTNENTNTFI